MFKELLLLLVLGHILGDFYVQTENMSENKEKDIKWVLLHGLYYGAMMIVCIIPIFSIQIVIVAFGLAIVHLTVDLLKHIIVIKFKKVKTYTLEKDRNIFLCDQIIHCLTIFLATYLVVANGLIIEKNSFITQFFEVIEVSELKVLVGVIAVLIVHKPANILIQKLLVIYKPESDNKVKNKDNNAGRFIGTIERVIMLVFLALGQYSAMGLVLTAKSIARYDRISKEKDFAEYYLLGTLLSTLIVIVVSLIL